MSMSITMVNSSFGSLESSVVLSRTLFQLLLKVWLPEQHETAYRRTDECTHRMTKAVFETVVFFVVQI